MVRRASTRLTTLRQVTLMEIFILKVRQGSNCYTKMIGMKIEVILED